MSNAVPTLPTLKALPDRPRHKASRSVDSRSSVPRDPGAHRRADGQHRADR